MYNVSGDKMYREFKPNYWMDSGVGWFVNEDSRLLRSESDKRSSSMSSSSTSSSESHMACSERRRWYLQGVCKVAVGFVVRTVELKSKMAESA